EPDGFLTRVTEVLRNAESPDALGLSYMPSLLGGVVADAPAKQAGLQRGDRIVAIDGTPVDYFEQLRSIVTESEGRTLVVNFRRPDSLADGEPEATLIADGDGYKEWQTGLTPEEITFGDGRYFGIGVQLADASMIAQEFGLIRRDLNPAEAVVAGVSETWRYGGLVLTS